MTAQSCTQFGVAGHQAGGPQRGGGVGGPEGSCETAGSRRILPPEGILPEGIFPQSNSHSPTDPGPTASLTAWGEERPSARSCSSRTAAISWADGNASCSKNSQEGASLTLWKHCYLEREQQLKLEGFIMLSIRFLDWVLD